MSYVQVLRAREVITSHTAACMSSSCLRMLLVCLAFFLVGGINPPPHAYACPPGGGYQPLAVRPLDAKGNNTLL